MNTTVKDMLRLVRLAIAGVMALFLLYVVAGVCALLGAPFLLLAAGIMFSLPFMALILADVVPILRRQQQMMCLHYLEQALRTHQPLVLVLRAAQLSERWPVSQQLRRMCVALETGQTLTQAVEAAIPFAPRRWLGLIATAERSGRLPQVLPSLLRSERARLLGQQPTVLPGLSLPLAEVMALFVTLVFVSLVILPKFQKIFDDFNAQLPAVTLGVFSTFQILTPWFLLLVPLIALIWAGWMLGRYFGGVRLTGPLRDMADSMLWFMPLIRQVQRDQSLGDSFTAMAQAMEAGSTLPSAIQQARELRINHLLLRNLLHWARLVEAGESADQASKTAGLPGFATAMLNSAVSSDCLPQTLAFLGSYYLTRGGRLIEFLRAASFPLITLVLGVIIGLVVYSLFLPLTVLIHSVLPNWNALTL